MMTALAIDALKKDFPIFKRTMRNGSSLVYLDSGATTQKPQAVIDAEVDFYSNHNAAVHRGSHLLAEEADAIYEGARASVARFIGADVSEIVFTKSATESLNIAAASLGKDLTTGDSIVVTGMEHHANLIPWQQVAHRTGATLRWIGVTEDGRLDLSNLDSLIDSTTRVLAFTHQSNVLGTINPVEQLVARARKVGAIVVLDACQSVPHFPVNVRELGIDLLAFSAHKALGPTGIGVLWGKPEVLDRLDPFIFGGSMIESVTMTDATWAAAPRKFEAGVPNMGGAAGFGAAIEYLEKIGMDRIAKWEHELISYALEKFQSMSGVTVFGPKSTQMRGATLSFAVDGIHPHDVGQVLDQNGIAVRTGHHCAWPLMKQFGITGTTRASFYIYNTLEDIDTLAEGVLSAQKYFGGGR